MADNPATTEITTSLPAAPPPGRDDSPEVYKSLSLPAVMGFVAAVLFSLGVLVGGLSAFAAKSPKVLAAALLLSPVAGLVVGVLLRERRTPALWGYAGYGVAAVVSLLGLGGLVAYSGSTPWVLPPFAWFVAVVGMLLCWIGRTQITASEGTQGGLGFSRWGIGLILFFGVNYAAYSLSNSLAVRAQGRQAAEEFLTHLKSGKIEDTIDAFLLTLPPTQRPSAGEDKRRAVEARFNAVKQAQGAPPLTQFFLSRCVREFAQQGADLTFTLQSSEEKFDRGGYSVDLLYLVKTADNEFEMAVVTRSEDVRDGATTRRSWHIDMNGTDLRRLLSEKPSAVTRRMTCEVAARFAAQWTNNLRQGPTGFAYFDTLTQDQRRIQLPARMMDNQAMLALAGVGVLSADKYTPEARAAYEAGTAAYAEGAILDKSEYYAGSNKSDRIFDELRRTFKVGGPGLGEVEPYKADIHKFRILPDGTAEVRVSVRIVVLDPNRVPRLVYETEAVVVGPVTDKPISSDSYRLAKLMVIRGSEAPVIGPGAPTPIPLN